MYKSGTALALESTRHGSFIENLENPGLQTDKLAQPRSIHIIAIRFASPTQVFKLEKMP